jgi:hypothetical protein
MSKQEKLRRLNKMEKGEIGNLLYEYDRAIKGERKQDIRHILYKYIERLLNDK